MVRWSDLDQSAPNVYVDPNMPESQQQILLSSIAAAEKHIATLYGEYTADPVIIAGHTMDVMKTYGGNSYNRAGRTYLTLLATIIILGPEGVLNEDILSHELAHAEFAARIGHSNKDEIPSWFDEGLAVQFDDRVTEAEWRTKTAGDSPEFDINQTDVIQHNDWLGYANSKREVRRWLDAVGQEGLQEFIQAIRAGEEFPETYRSIESAHTTGR
jgi:hypothetical protein